MTDDQLREWAYRTGDADVGAAVIRVLLECAALRRQVEGHCERIAAQSALLSRKAEGESVPYRNETVVLASAELGTPEAEKLKYQAALLAGTSHAFDGTYPMRGTVADFRSKGTQ